MNDESNPPADPAATAIVGAEGDRPEATRDDARHRRNPLRPVTIAAVSVAVIAVTAALYFGRVLLLPLATAILLSLALRPVARLMSRVGLPYPLSALILVAVIGIGVVSAVAGLSEPAKQWIQEAPRSLQQLHLRIYPLKKPIEDIREATEAVQKMGQVERRGVTSVVVEDNHFPTLVLTETRVALTGVFLTLIMLFFVLGWGRHFYRQLVIALPGFTSQRQVAAIVNEMQQSVASYLATITVINLILGAVVALVLKFMGMPNPILWGVMTGLLNFIPYLGPALTAFVLTIVALMSFPTLGEAFAIPAVFLLITSIEGYFITPMAVGSRLALNPLVIFVALLFWFWIWGIIGGLLTVPILVCFKIILEEVYGEDVAAIMG